MNWLLYLFISHATDLLHSQNNNAHWNAVEYKAAGRPNCTVPCFTPGHLDEAISLAHGHLTCVRKGFQCDFRKAVSNIKVISKNVYNSGNSAMDQLKSEYQTILNNFIADLRNSSKYETPQEKECLQKAIRRLQNSPHVQESLKSWKNCIDSSLQDFNNKVHHTLKGIEKSSRESSEYVQKLTHCLKNIKNKMGIVLCAFQVMSSVPPVMSNNFHPHVASLKAFAEHQTQQIAECKPHFFIPGNPLIKIKQDFMTCIAPLPSESLPALKPPCDDTIKEVDEIPDEVPCEVYEPVTDCKDAGKTNCWICTK